MKVQRIKQRDGIVTGEAITVDLAPDDTAVDIVAALKGMAVFQSAQERIGAHQAGLNRAIAAGAKDNQLIYATRAVEYFGWARESLDSITDPTSRRAAQNAVADLIRAFEFEALAGIKALELEVITGARHRTEQKAKAQAPRTLKDVDDIIKKLARRDGSAKGLWREFISMMDRAGIKAIERCDAVIYETDSGNERSMSQATFGNRLGKARK